VASSVNASLGDQPFTKAVSSAPLFQLGKKKLLSAGRAATYPLNCPKAVANAASVGATCSAMLAPNAHLPLSATAMPQVLPSGSTTLTAFLTSVRNWKSKLDWVIATGLPVAEPKMTDTLAGATIVQLALLQSHSKGVSTSVTWLKAEGSCTVSKLTSRNWPDTVWMAA